MLMTLHRLPTPLSLSISPALKGLAGPGAMKAVWAPSHLSAVMDTWGSKASTKTQGLQPWSPGGPAG